MKWLVALILAANVLVWLAADLWAPERTRIVAENQTLPRVSTLKLDAALADPDPELELEPEPEALVGIAEQVRDPAPSAPAIQTCVRLGWFETAEAAREAYRSLGRPGNAYAIREQERALEPLHWVIIPPQPEDRALGLFNDLQRRGIDSYLVVRGENRNAISLGLFQSEEAAKRVLDAKKRQNLNAVLANFPRNQLSYALVFEVSRADGVNAGDGMVSDYRRDFEMVEISRCQGIATTLENP